MSYADYVFETGLEHMVVSLYFLTMTGSSSTRIKDNEKSKAMTKNLMRIILKHTPFTLNELSLTLHTGSYCAEFIEENEGTVMPVKAYHEYIINIYKEIMEDIKNENNKDDVKRVRIVTRNATGIDVAYYT